MLKRFLILLSFIVFLLVSPPLAKADCDPSQYNVNSPQQFRGASCPSNYCEISHTGSPPNTLYTCAPSITDNKITFGPVHIITPDSYNGDSKITITVTTKNPDASYNNIDVPKLAPQVYYLDSVNNLINGSTNPNSPTTIDIPISSIKLIVNGQQNSCVSFGVDTSAGSNPLPQSHIAGDSTGEFNFAGSRVPGCNFGQSSSQVGDATIALNPPSITKNDDEQISVTLKNPIANSYSITMQDTARGGCITHGCPNIPHATITVNCPNGACSSVSVDNKYPDNLFASDPQLTTSSDVDYLVNFSIDGAILTEGHSYQVGVSSSNPDKIFSPASFLVKSSDTGTLQISINPSSIPENQTANTKITVIIAQALASHQYRITLTGGENAFMGPCTGDAKNCQGQISIGPKGKTQGSYEVKVTDTTSTSNLFGITNLIVTTPINTTTQGSSGVCTTVPSSVKNCSDFKTGDYIINIPVNKTCTTSDGNPKGVQCANTSDQFCKASDGTTIQCAALTSCKDSLVCRTGYTTEACDSSVDTSKNCCAQINGAIIQDPKVACSVIQTTTTGAQPCDPTPETTGTGIKTAIGCIPTQPQQLVQGFVRVISFASGGIALLLMIFGAIGIITSAGNPERLKQSQEQFTSAIIGLLFIIFSVLLLQIIGVDILNIPGFGRS